MTRQVPAELLYFVSGLWCQSCGSTVESLVAHCPGVVESKLNFATKILRVQVEPVASLEETDRGILERAKPSGFSLRRLHPGWVHNFKKELKTEMERRVQFVHTALVLFLAMWSSMLAFAGYLGGLPAEQDYLLACLTTAFGLPAILLGVQPFARAGIRALRSGRNLTLDLFISLGAFSAGALSVSNLSRNVATTYVDSAAMILALLLIAKHLEADLSYRLSSRILDTVKPLQDRVDVFRHGVWKSCPVDQVRTEERVRIEAGQTIALDGRVAEEGAELDGHLMTGENERHRVAEGDEVLAGMIAHSPLQLWVSRPLGCRTIDSWAESALVSPEREHVFSKLIRGFEKRLVSVALCGASLVSLARMVLTGSPAQAAEGFFVGILVFCPCLFASILPLAKQLATLKLWRCGVLLQRAEALFDLLAIKRIYLDKTGTLEGVDTVFEPIVEDPEKLLQAQALLSLLQAHCRHPVLRGLTPTSRQAGRAPTDFKELSGQGVRATFPGLGTITVGRPDFVKRETGMDPAFKISAHYPLVALHRSPVGVLVSKTHFDHLGLKFLDELTSEVKAGVEVEILSGDPNPEASARYKSLYPWPIKYSGNLSPEEKAERIVNPALFVGDGLNDTMAMARAQVSCRIGERTRDFVPVDLHILGANLPALTQVLKYSRSFVKILKQTAALAFLYNILALGLAAFGLFSPLGAALAMLLSFLFLLASVSRLLS